MSNIHSSFDGLSKEEFFSIRNEIFRATSGMAAERDVNVTRDDATGRVKVHIAGLQVDNIQRMLALLAVLGTNAVVETDELQETRKRAGEQERIGKRAA